MPRKLSKGAKVPNRKGKKDKRIKSKSILLYLLYGFYLRTLTKLLSMLPLNIHRYFMNLSPDVIEDDPDISPDEDIRLFNEQLKPLGLYVRDVERDGNCLFRAICDQMLGTCEKFQELRQETCDYMKNHEDQFKPFVEEDLMFEDYLKEMRQDATWAGHMELQAIAMIFKVNIRVFQLNSPAYDIINFPSTNSTSKLTSKKSANSDKYILANTRAIYLSYHQGEHYASVRNLSEEEASDKPTKFTLAYIGDEMEKKTEKLMLESGLSKDEITSLMVDLDFDIDAVREHIEKTYKCKSSKKKARKDKKKVKKDTKSPEPNDGGPTEALSKIATLSI